MVRISPQQEKALADLLNNKKIYEKRLAQIEADARVRKAQEKQSLAERVRAALALGIPARQVALKGLGYADVGSLKQYTNPLEVNFGPVATEPEPEPVKPEGYTFEGSDEFQDWDLFYNGEQVGSVWTEDYGPINLMAIKKRDDWDTLKPILSEKFGTNEFINEE